MYDARFGRWISPDPYAKFNSPYIGMGNNPGISEYSKKFIAMLVGLDIEDFKIPMSRSQHRLKPDGIHTKNGGDWNGRWKEWFDKNPEPTKFEVLQKLFELRREFGM